MTKEIETEDNPRFYVWAIPKKGDKGPDVKVLQGRLKDAGFSPGPLDGHFWTRTETAVKKLQKSLGLPGKGKIGSKTLEALHMEVGLGDGLGKAPKGIPSREEMLGVVIGMIEGDIPVQNGPFKIIRETKGKNRSAEIDALIKRQGGTLGDPYCAWGQQEILDELCAYYEIDRKKVKLNEGGSCDSLFKKLDKAGVYRVKAPVPVSWVIFRYPNGKGHIEMPLSTADKKGNFRAFGFNTTAKGAEVVRDGQGAGYTLRSVKGYGDAKVRGYFDVYQAIVDAMEVKNG